MARLETKPFDSKPAPTSTVPSTAPVIAQLAPPRISREQEAEARFEKAKRLYGSGLFDEAQAICERLLKESPSLTGVHNTLGEIYARQRKWTEAKTQFEEAIKEDNTNPEYHNNLGLALSLTGQDELAEKHLREANKLDALNQTVLMNLVWHLRKLERYSEALVYLESSLVLNPNDPVVRNKWIQTLLDVKRYDKAEEEIQNQLKTNPTNPQAMMMMAVMYSRQGKVDQAIDWLRKAEVITTSSGMRKMLEQINDFDLIKETPQFQTYFESLAKAG